MNDDNFSSFHKFVVATTTGNIGAQETPRESINDRNGATNEFGRLSELSKRAHVPVSLRKLPF